MGFVPSNVSSSSACADRLELLHFPIGVSEQVNVLGNVIKLADASFFRTGRKRWGFKRLSS